MDGWKRRAIGYFVLVGVALLLTAAGYQYGMRVFENRPRTYIDSLQFAVEMFTTTGFGGDARWTTAEMQLFITVTDLLGMALLVGALPVVASPLLERAFKTVAPTELDSDVEDHVIICSDTSRTEELVPELNAGSVPYVLVEPDRERARELYEDGHRVIRVDPESTGGLRAARLEDARALFVDISDKVDASIVLAAKELTEDVPIVSVVEDQDHERYHRLAGADDVLLPRQLVGQSLARKVTTAYRSDIEETVEIDESLQLAEVSIHHGSDLAGTTLAESRIRERSGVNVIGAWFRGQFDPSPSPDETLSPGTVLAVSGTKDQLDQFVGITQGTVRAFESGKTVVAGFGQVGQMVASELNDADIPHTIIDTADREGVDIVGDATEPSTLREAGIEDAQTVVLALPDDTTTEFATLVVRDMVPNVEILARVNENANISKTYRAGANYVLSLATVTGRMSVSYLLEQKSIVSLDQGMKITRSTAPALVGRSLGEADVRRETGCNVIAIERAGEMRTEIDPTTTIEAGDELMIVGTDDGTRKFEQLFS